MSFGNDTTICHSKSGQTMKVLKWFILHVKSKWTYIKCTVQNGSFCTQKQLNIHQMYGSERFILHVNDMNFLNGSERFRTVHELSDFWEPFPKERFRTVHLFGCPFQMNGSERFWTVHCVSGILPNFSFDDGSSSYAASNSHHCTGFASESERQRTLTIIWKTENINILYKRLKKHIIYTYYV